VQEQEQDESVAPAKFLGWGLVIAACILGISCFDSRTHARVFVACTAVAAIAYLRTMWLLSRFAGGSNRGLALCLVLAAAWRVPLLLSPPTLSTDVYRYVWDGRIQRLGYDPYLVVPSNSTVQHLHTAETLLMNHPDFPTPYPAVAELFFRVVAMVDDSARAMRSAAFLSLCSPLVAVRVPSKPVVGASVRMESTGSTRGRRKRACRSLRCARSCSHRCFSGAGKAHSFCCCVRARSRGQISSGPVGAPFLGSHPSS